MSSNTRPLYNLVFIGLLGLMGCREDMEAQESQQLIELPAHEEVRYHGDGSVAWLKGADLAASLYGTQYTNLKQAGDFGAMADYFLSHYAEALKTSDPNLRFVVSKVQSDDIGFHQVRVEQTYHQLPVVGSEVIVHFDTQQNLYLISGRYTRAHEELSPMPKASLQDAKKRIQDMGKASIDGSYLVVFAESTPRLAYRFLINQNTLGAKEVILDANDL
ncbi:MAG: hypothetical protein AAF438_18320 [Pseudomonadota bacterium]